MKNIILVYFVFRGLNIILIKYNLYDKFHRYSMGKSKFLFELSKCSFCIHHHLSILATLLVGFLNGFEMYFIILPIVSASIQNLIYDRSND